MQLAWGRSCLNMHASTVLNAVRLQKGMFESQTREARCPESGCSAAGLHDSLLQLVTHCGQTHHTYDQPTLK
jgi:hypothetical protein